MHQTLLGFSLCTFQLRLRKRLLHDSAPQGWREIREHCSWSKWQRAFTSAHAGRTGAGDKSHQPSLPDPKTGTGSALTRMQTSDLLHPPLTHIYLDKEPLENPLERREKTEHSITFKVDQPDFLLPN